MRPHIVRTTPGLLAAAVLLSACGGGGGDGPRVSAAPQAVSVGSAPALVVGGQARVQATSSAGLAVRYGSLTPTVCSVDAASGLVSGLAAGTCTISVDQAGSADWAPAPQATLSFPVAAEPQQTLLFGSAPPLTLGGMATVQASASSGLPVSYSSLSAGVCTVDPSSGLVTDLTLGDCVIAADQPGDASHAAATRVTQTLPVQVPAGVTVPGIPQGVTATLGSSRTSVVVSVGAVDSGGNAIRRYTVVSSPAGISATAATAPVTVNCPAGCGGYAFSVSAGNAVGDGEASAPVHVLTSFDVLATFHEPDTQPRDTVFAGTLVLDSTSGTVQAASGQLTESMTGNAVGAAPFYDMTQVALGYLLQGWHDDALGGSFVAVFAKNTPTTFSTLAGGDGWSPAAGVANGGLYAGFPAAYGSSVQNSYVLLFVPDDPFAALTPAQIDKLAYADCAPGGMMGAVCMTGTSTAGYGSTGTMSGYPVSQTLTRH